MNKQEFINRLRAALSGRVSVAVLNENINYYEDYINTQIRMGRTEEEVLASLGDPRLIAKTIIETNSQSGNDQNDYVGRTEAGNAYKEKDYRQDRPFKYNGTFKFPTWLTVVIVVIVVLFVLSLILSVISFLAPFLLTIFVVLFLVKLFRDWLN